MLQMEMDLNESVSLYCSFPWIQDVLSVLFHSINQNFDEMKKEV